MSSAYRPREDKAWNYLRPPPHVLPYIMFKPASGETHECVVLDGHRGKTMSNSDDPPNSWYTSDLFIPHPAIPNAWKFVSRMDDRITLINGEKVLPLGIEGRIRNHPLVREAVVFGVDREMPGLLLFRALGSSQLKDQEFLDQVWPTIEYTNGHAESFSQIKRDMVVIVPENVDYPQTDKSSIKRGLIYKEFASEIDGVYASASNTKKIQPLVLTKSELEDWVLRTVRAQGCKIEDVTSDFFSAGMDSLQAINIRGLILKHIDVGGRESQITSMSVFDCGNAERLAQRLDGLRTGEDAEDDQGRAIKKMEALIDKYSTFERQDESHCAGDSPPTSQNEQVIVSRNE